MNSEVSFVNFFSGFSLCGEEIFFEDFIKKSDYCVAGFSKGAIDALQYALNAENRIDTLQLFSPAYFADKEDSFKRAQLHYFKKNAGDYIDRFLKNCAYPSQIDLKPFYREEEIGELERLLNFGWREKDLVEIVKRGMQIEVFLGGEDKIIDSFKAREFFLPYAEVYFIKERGHLLNG